MSTHTPGPWRLELANSGARIAAANGTQICAAMAGNHANARLIAAAPDLLKALIVAIECGEMDGPESALAALNTHGRAAIAKTEGRKP